MGARRIKCAELRHKSRARGRAGEEGREEKEQRGRGKWRQKNREVAEKGKGREKGWARCDAWKGNLRVHPQGGKGRARKGKGRVEGG